MPFKGGWIGPIPTDPSTPLGAQVPEPREPEHAPHATEHGVMLTKVVDVHAFP